MKKVVLCAVLAAALMAGSANAATLFLTNSAGGNLLDLTATGSGDMQVRLTTASVDTIQISFINAFLDTTGVGIDADSVDVASVVGGNASWIPGYDRSAFPNLPSEIDQAGSGDEYGLVSGDSDGSAAYPLGAATYVHDTLNLVDTNAPLAVGTVNVTFELGARQPQAFGGPPGFTPFTVAPPPFFPPGFSNFLYLGDATSSNDPFIVTKVPEPGSVVLFGMGLGLAGLRRKANR
jgi:hypothetical protein